MQEHTNGHKNGHKPETLGNGLDPQIPVLLDGLSPKAIEEISKPLDAALVSTRKGRGGRQFPYLEGYAAIDQANRIFGYGGWGYEVAGDVTYREIQILDAKTGQVSATGMYCATVRVTVPGVPYRTDVGCQAVAEETPEGHDTAYKGAVTDALKRSLRAFGNQFGNGLYGEGAEADPIPALRESVLHLGKAQGLDEAKLRDAVKKRTGKDLNALSASDLAGLIQAMTRKQASSSNNGPTSSPANGERRTNTNGSAPVAAQQHNGQSAARP